VSKEKYGGEILKVVVTMATEAASTQPQCIANMAAVSTSPTAHRASLDEATAHTHSDPPSYSIAAWYSHTHSSACQP